MARPKKDKALKPVGVGHNSGELNDDQLQALTRQHAQKRARLLDVEKRAKADRMNFDKVIKAELGAKGLANIKLLELLSTPEGEAELVAEMERQARVARWAGLVIGTQGNLFGEDRRTAEEKAAEAGKRAGLSGENCQPPSGYNDASREAWVQAWHAGQAVLASGFMKNESDDELLRPESEDEGQEDDFNAAADGDFGDDGYRPGDEVDVETDEEPFDPPSFIKADTETAGAA
jgi:hypothetical protein